MMSSENCDTTPKSCVIRIIAVPSLRLISSNAANISACTVIPNVVVGSSAMIMSGSPMIDIAMNIRCRNPALN